ncbi:MAG: histidine phosphatase family protein [Chloroflexota bacterium]|jgi:broad specificity phosphatase PhoE|nr:histidine phosphatase family protein [Chloroflexota bacterium]
MNDVVFVRHASTSWTGRRYCGRSDPPLDAAGLTEARALAAALAPTLPRDVLIVTSPAHRARATAEVLAAAAQVTAVEIDERWREADFGIAEGRTFDELAAMDPRLAEALAGGVTDIDWPGGERAADLGVRIAQAWNALRARGRPALVVSHGGAIRHAVALARSLPTDAVPVLEPATSIRVELRAEESGSARMLPSRP